MPPPCPDVCGQERNVLESSSFSLVGSACLLLSLVGKEVLRPVRTKRFPDLIAGSLLLVLLASFSFSWWKRGFSGLAGKESASPSCLLLVGLVNNFSFGGVWLSDCRQRDSYWILGELTYIYGLPFVTRWEVGKSWVSVTSCWVRRT